ncbi:hypothetical protein RchiOBHm_Chr5g0061431 [Rosa chinensis]|uniref:Uncharacterized protein n=1 Tax=Rosa chinensis TaxID=74649 RepID=A0A2P6QHX8_ROSCH|nr:hypothetical protein RchiOBHm_Chr5g0061431 [Rosa chinensis]
MSSNTALSSSRGAISADSAAPKWSKRPKCKFFFSKNLDFCFFWGFEFIWEIPIWRFCLFLPSCFGFD